MRATGSTTGGFDNTTTRGGDAPTDKGSFRNDETINRQLEERLAEEMASMGGHHAEFASYLRRCLQSEGAERARREAEERAPHPTPVDIYPQWRPAGRSWRHAFHPSFHRHRDRDTGSAEGAATSGSPDCKRARGAPKVSINGTDVSVPGWGLDRIARKTQAAQDDAAARAARRKKGRRAVDRLRAAGALEDDRPSEEFLSRLEPALRETVTREFDDAAVDFRAASTMAGTAAPFEKWATFARGLGGPILKPEPGSDEMRTREFNECLAAYSATLRSKSKAATAVSRPLQVIGRVCEMQGRGKIGTGPGGHLVTLMRSTTTRQRKSVKEGSKSIEPQVIANICMHPDWGRSENPARVMISDYMCLAAYYGGRWGDVYGICSVRSLRWDDPKSPVPEHDMWILWFRFRKFKEFLHHLPCTYDRQRPILCARRRFYRILAITGGRRDALLCHVKISRDGSLTLDPSRRLEYGTAQRLIKLALRDGGVPKKDLTVLPTVCGGITDKQFSAVRGHGIRKMICTTLRAQARDSGRRVARGEVVADDAIQRRYGHEQLASTLGYDEHELEDHLVCCERLFRGVRIDDPANEGPIRVTMGQAEERTE